MATITCDPYLFFRGDCREAMEFYKAIFGGELTIVPYEDTPVNMEDMKGKVMHALLTGGDVRLMASDTPKASEKAAKISISLMSEDEATLRRMFDELGEGGTVQYPLKKEFWGDIHGSLTDKFGIEWMVTVNAPQQV